MPLHYRERFHARSTPTRTRLAMRQGVELETYESDRPDAIFIVLRRLRLPLLTLLGIMVVATVGLSLMPGDVVDGRVQHISLFHSFYFVSYTAATIGYGEIGPFSTAQRMWVTGTIYATVLGWAYAVGVILTLFQDQTFLSAMREQRFRRRVAHIREPYVVLIGYGRAGRTIAAELDAYGRRVVVIDADVAHIERLSQDNLHAEVPGLDANPARPSSLMLAGVNRPNCQAVVAVTSDDEVNLAVAITATLANPDVRTFASVINRSTEEMMRDFGTDVVINPGDLFGAYLMLGLQRPQTALLINRLLGEDFAQSLGNPGELQFGHWLVVSDDEFLSEIDDDLRSAGNTVDTVSPDAVPDNFSNYVGVVAGASSDTVNLAVVRHAQDENPDLYTVARQEMVERLPLIKRLGANAMYSPQIMVATEVLTGLLSARFHYFIEYLLDQDDAWAAAVWQRLHARLGDATPVRRDFLTLTRQATPSLLVTMRGRQVTLGDILRDPEDRERHLRVFVLVLRRDGQNLTAPEDDTVLQPGDDLLLFGVGTDISRLQHSVQDGSAMDYLMTGLHTPRTWIWRRLRMLRRRLRH